MDLEITPSREELRDAMHQGSLAGNGVAARTEQMVAKPGIEGHEYDLRLTDRAGAFMLKVKIAGQCKGPPRPVVIT